MNLNHLPRSTHAFLHLPLKSRELPLTSDANDLLLDSHFILELLVVPK